MFEELEQPDAMAELVRAGLEFDRAAHLLPLPGDRAGIWVLHEISEWAGAGDPTYPVFPLRRAIYGIPEGLDSGDEPPPIDWTPWRESRWSGWERVRWAALAARFGRPWPPGAEEPRVGWRPCISADLPEAFRERVRQFVKDESWSGTLRLPSEGDLAGPAAGILLDHLEQIIAPGRILVHSCPFRSGYDEVYAGALGDLRERIAEVGVDACNVWAPGDGWSLSTHDDLDATWVTGPPKLIDALAADSRLETMPASP